MTSSPWKAKLAPQRRRRHLACLVALLAGAALSAGAGGAAAMIVNRIVATVDGDPITLYDLKKFVQKHTNGQLPPGITYDSPTVLQPCITERIVQKEISDQGIVIRDEDVDKQIQHIMAQNHLTPDQFQQAVAAQGISMDEFRQRLREEIEKAQLINREIRGKVNVTPEEVQRYYEAHKDEYATPGQVHVRHIVLRLDPNASPEEVQKVMDKAAELRKRIEDGEDFATLAKQYSEGPAAASGGDLGNLKKGEMLDEFEAAVDKLKVGEVSPPVRTSVGVHLIMLEEKSGEGHTGIAELQGEIKDKLYNAALEERYQRWLTEDLPQRHHVEIRP